MPPGHRQTGVTNTQRAALRQHAAKNPQLTQNQLKLWFEGEFGRSITQPTISASLSPNYEHLDDSTQDVRPLAKRGRLAQYPELEEALTDWMQETQNVLPLTEEAIRAQATLLFKNMEIYQGLKMPAFSRSWLQGFRRRQNLDFLIDPQSPTSSQNKPPQDRQPIMAWQWPLANIFNCDEASLFRELMPYANGYAEPSFTDAMNKFKLTALLCSNATGEERLPIWFIGDEQELGSLDGTFHHIQELGPDWLWKHDASASMTIAIFVEWLIWFDDQAHGRENLLLLRSRDAHVSAVQAVSSGNRPLRNTTVIWLSCDEHNATSTPPTELDIVEIFKLYYAKRWLTLILSEIEARRDPQASMNLLRASSWALEVWSRIQPTSILNCFYTTRMWDRLHPIDRSSFILRYDTDIAV